MNAGRITPSMRWPSTTRYVLSNLPTPPSLRGLS
jgi:hypothetical protein